MKKLKYILVFIVGGLFIPNIVNAEKVTYDYKKYNVGDEITVYLNESKTLTGIFNVIKTSNDGSEEV